MNAAALERLLGASRHLGLPRVWDLLRGGRVRVLMYHGVPAKDRFEGVENHYRYNVPLAEFERHMEYLAERCKVVSLRDLLAARGLDSRRMNVVLTFDDGYENNATNALPVLERLGLPAVFALASAFVARREPLWNDVVEHAVRHAGPAPVELELDGQRRHFDPSTPAGRLELYNALLRACVRIEQERRDEVLDAALEALGGTRAGVLADPDYRPLTPEQVARLGRSELVEVASHSVHHYLLGKLPPERVRAEVREARATLEELSGGPVTAFCMPGGSYDQRVLSEIFDAGHDVVLTSDLGTVSPEQRVLKRCGIFSRDSMHWFVDQVHGPVQEVVEVTQRARSALRRRLDSHRQRSTGRTA